MKKYQLLIIAIIIGLFSSCATDEAIEPEGPRVVEVGFCDTITYSTHIAPIFATNCTLSRCHDGSDATRLDYRTYDVVSSNSTLILSAIKQEGSFKMPLDPDTWQPFKLADSTITLIECWIENGTKND